MKKLPIVKFTINEDDINSGVDFVALVDDPAIKQNWMAFNAHKQLFQVTDEEKRIVTGPLMIADLPIYRKSDNPDMPEYYAVFDSETIYKIVQKFFKEKKNTSVNIMHQPDARVDNVYMYESFIINTDRGINTPKGFDVVANGSWFGSFKIENNDVWSEVKNGTFKGFSVEGFFEQTTQSSEEKMMAQIINILELMEQK